MRYATSRIAIALASLLAFSGSSVAVEQPDGGVRGDLLKVEDLPRLRAGVQTHQFCTFDRSGDNYDWDYFALYMEPNGEAVLFDATGPGCLYRQQMNIWMPTGHPSPDTKGLKIRYYFDGEKKPRIDMDVSTFFSEKNPLGIFREPLSMNGGVEFRTMYCPMQFQKRLKIALSRLPGGPGNHQKPWMGRYDAVTDPDRAHWCHFTYHTFSEDPGIASWTPGQVSSSLLTLWDSKKLGQDPKPTAGNQKIDKTLSLPPGKKVCLAEIEGAGSIASLRINVEPLSEESLFQTWITMTWDGHASPQVEAPLGAFFGGYRKAIGTSFSSLLFGYSPAGMYCYFPMPYWKSATIEIENRGKQATKTLKASVQYKPADACSYPEKQCGYFCAHYNRMFPRIEGHDYKYLDWNGRGQVVGHTTSRYDTSMDED